MSVMSVQTPIPGPSPAAAGEGSRTVQDGPQVPSLRQRGGDLGEGSAPAPVGNPIGRGGDLGEGSACRVEYPPLLRGGRGLNACILLIACALAACAPAAAPPLPTLVELPALTATPDAAPRPLPFWTPVEGALTGETAAAVWTFSAQGGDAVRLRALGPVNLALRAPDGAALGAGTEFGLRLPADGVYTVTVQLAGADAGRYQLGLAYTDRPDPASYTATPPLLVVGVPTATPFFAEQGTVIGALEAGASVEGRFSGRASVPHVYTFDGRAGQYISVELARTSGTVDPVLLLYDPAGAPLAVDDNAGGGGDALLRSVPLRADGRYSVVASGKAQPGGYRLTLTASSRPQPVTPTIVPRPSVTPFALVIAPTAAPAAPGSRLQDHAPVSAAIDRPGGFGRYSIAAAAGDFLTVGVAPADGSGLRPALELFGPDGVLLARDSAPRAGAEALVAMWPAASDGLYTVLVTGADDTAGAFTLSYGLGPSREEHARGSAAADTPYEGQLVRRGARDVWTLALNRGDVITAAASPTSAAALDPLLELVGPDGSVVASDDNSGGAPSALIQRATAPAAGIYQLRVAAANAASAGPYRLIWRYIEAAPTPTPDPPRYLLLSAADSVAPGAYHFFPFQGRAGQTVRLRAAAAPGSRLDPVVALLGPDGMVVAEGDDIPGSLDAEIIFTIPADGTYTARVSGYLSGGPFDLVVDVLL